MKVAERRQRWAESQKKDVEHKAWLRTFPVQVYRDRHYAPKVRGTKVRWWFEPIRGVIDGGYHPDNYRNLGVEVRMSGGRDWEGSCYTVQLATFRRVPSGGWMFNEQHFSTLLRAVRHWLAKEKMN